MLRFTLVLIRSAPTRAGQEPNEQVVESMMSEAPGPLNFTMFLTLFGEKLNGMCVCACVRARVACGVCVCVCVRVEQSKSIPETILQTNVFPIIFWHNKRFNSLLTSSLCRHRSRRCDTECVRLFR